MSLILGLFGSMDTTLYTIIAILLVIGVAYLLIKIPELRPIALLVFLVVFVFCGFSACYHNIRYLTSTNMTVGDVINSYIKTTQTTTTVTENKPEWLIENLGFRLVEDNTYTSTLILDPYNDLDFKNNTYSLFINNEQCLINETGNNYIRSQYPYTFFDNDNNVILTDTLYINFVFHTNETKLVLKTDNGQIAVNLWRSYQAKNNFLLAIKNSTNENVYFNTINKIDGEFAIYDFENGTLNGYTVAINTTYSDTLTLPYLIANQQITQIKANAFIGLSLNEISFRGTSTEFLNINKSTNWNTTIDNKFIEKVNCYDKVLVFSSNGSFIANTDNLENDDVEELKNNILVCKYQDNTTQAIELDSVKLTADLIPDIKNLTEIHIPNSVFELDDNLFNDADNLYNVYIGKNLSVVNNWSFVNCEKFNVDIENENFSSLDGNLYNKDQTIMYRYATKKTTSSFSVPDTVKEIFNYCFTSSLNLTEIKLPNTVETLGIGSFRYCTKLTSINIVDNITIIPDSCFYGCISLTEIDLSNVTTIYSHAFQYCKSLNTITISGYIQELKIYLFSSCDKDITIIYTSLKWNFENNVSKAEKWCYDTDYPGYTITVICTDGILTYNTFF